MGELNMTTLTLAEMRQIKRIQAVTDKPLYLFFTEASAVNSLLLEQLLFRLENHGHPVTVFLLDHATVSLRDVHAGAYLESDVGSSRSLSLVRRYSGFFPNVMIVSAFASVISETVTHNAFRLFFLHANEEPNVINTHIDALRQQTTEDKIIFFRQGLTTEGTLISMRVLIKKQYYGGGEPFTIARTNQNFSQQYVQNSLTAQRLFGMVNELVSDGGSVSYYELTGDIAFDQMSPKYLLGRLWDGFVSKYEPMYNGLNTTQDTLQALAHAFDDFIDIPENNARLTATKTRLEGTPFEEVAVAQLGYLMKTMTKYRETLNSNSDEYRKVMLVIGILMKLGQASTREVFGNDYLNIILMFIFFTKETIFHDDIF